jgi:hypothetical protein
MDMSRSNAAFVFHVTASRNDCLAWPHFKAGDAQQPDHCCAGRPEFGMQTCYHVDHAAGVFGIS